jgi:hypothetical protein
MKQRLGALLCLALGAVLITTGLTAGGAGTVGDVVPISCSGGIGVAIPCPTGKIAITESTVTTTGSSATPPAGGWQVDITSTCNSPLTGQPASITVTVPDGGTGTSTELFLFTDETHGTVCTYALAEHVVTGFVQPPVFDPASPVTIPFTPGESNANQLDVDLTNTESAPASTSAAPSTSDPASSSVVVSASAIAVSSAAAAPIASTGPRDQVRASVYIGAALCLLGLFLLIAGSIGRRRGQHTA